MPYKPATPKSVASIAAAQDIVLDPACVSDIENKSGKSLLFLLAVHEDGDITSFINPTTIAKDINALPITTTAITNTQVVSLITYKVNPLITGIWRLVNGVWKCTSYQSTSLAASNVARNQKKPKNKKKLP
jgi:hypothetical protein